MNLSDADICENDDWLGKGTDVGEVYAVETKTQRYGPGALEYRGGGLLYHMRYAKWCN